MSGDDPRVDLLAEAWVGRAVWASMDEGAREGMRPHYRDLLARLDAALAERSTEGGLERARDLVESHLHLITEVRPEEPRFTITTDENGAEAAVTTARLADLMTSSKRPAETDPDPAPTSLGDWCNCQGGPQGPWHPLGDTTCRYEPQRPAEREPDPDLVAAFMAEFVPQVTERFISEQGKQRWRERAERMAAVAQARIDAAVNAERARIRDALVKKLDDGSIAEGRAYRAALAVVGRGPGAQR